MEDAGNETSEVTSSSAVGRRKFLVKAAVAGSVAWAVPAIITMEPAGAAALTSPPPTPPVEVQEETVIDPGTATTEPAVSPTSRFGAPWRSPGPRSRARRRGRGGDRRRWRVAPLECSGRAVGRSTIRARRAAALPAATHRVTSSREIRLFLPEYGPYDPDGDTTRRGQWLL